MRQDVEQLEVGPERRPAAGAPAHRAKREIALHVRQPAERGQQGDRHPRGRLEQELVAGAHLESARRRQLQQRGRIPQALGERLLHVDVRTRLQRLRGQHPVGGRWGAHVHDVHAPPCQHLAQRAERRDVGRQLEQGLPGRLGGVGHRHQPGPPPGALDGPGVVHRHLAGAHETHPQGGRGCRGRGSGRSRSGASVYGCCHGVRGWGKIQASPGAGGGFLSPIPRNKIVAGRPRCGAAPPRVPWVPFLLPGTAVLSMSSGLPRPLDERPQG